MYECIRAESTTGVLAAWRGNRCELGRVHFEIGTVWLTKRFVETGGQPAGPEN